MITIQHESVFKGPCGLKVLEAIDRGMVRKEEVARSFGISPPSIKRWARRRMESGDVVEPSPIPGPLATKEAILEEWLCRASSKTRS